MLLLFTMLLSNRRIWGVEAKFDLCGHCDSVTVSDLHEALGRGEGEHHRVRSVRPSCSSYVGGYHVTTP